METKEHKKKILKDFEITADVKNENFSRKIFCRAYAVNLVFTEVNFKQCVLDQCYFRNCKFLRCDFTGTEFKSCNLRGAQFDGCKFMYSTWEKTIIEENFLDYCLPSEENIARDLVQELRVNFSQIGNYPAVNHASSIEVKLTGIHLYKSAYSRESYYREKHKGWNRVLMAYKHLKWKILDLLWGNGESIFKVILSATFIIIILTTISFKANGIPWIDNLEASFLGFWGVHNSVTLPTYISTCLTISRFTFFGLFLTILVKRLARR
jgi:hypothetical protein